MGGDRRLDSPGAGATPRRMPVGRTGEPRRDPSLERGNPPPRERGGRARGLRRFLASPPAPSSGNPARGTGGLEAALEQLQGYAATAELWETEILPAPGSRAIERPGSTTCWRPEAGSGVPRRRQGRALGRLRSPRFRGRLARRPGRRRRISGRSGRSSTILGVAGPASRPTWRGASGLEPSRLRRAPARLDDCVAR